MALNLSPEQGVKLTKKDRVHVAKKIKQGWKAICLIPDYGFDKNTASDIYKSMISEPGNYCKYVLGYIGFSELKETAKQQLKDSFNLKEFHRFIMDTGPVSFDTLNTQLKLWMEQS